MNQVMKGQTSIRKVVDEMEKNKANEITRIMFLPKTDAVIISFNQDNCKEVR